MAQRLFKPIACAALDPHTFNRLDDLVAKLRVCRADVIRELVYSLLDGNTATLDAWRKVANDVGEGGVNL